MKHMLAFALLFTSIPAAAATVEVADGNWSFLPQLEKRGSHHLTAEAITTIHQRIVDGECRLPGQTKRELDLTIPFAAHFSPDGSLDRLVIKRLGCAHVEGVVGGVLLEMMKAGEYRPTGANEEG